MPRYDFRCRDCADTFEVTRPMSDSALPAPCPAGHTDTVRVLSTLALTGAAGAAGPRPAPSGGGGCCGGGCCS
ncbi:MAG: hypothetical protein AVDCRST_MAG41-2669 [uncultured Corynebacteriales bacterium]|uniref:Putative regulatory protein FmdB zinc ribbon domain-containing protein n=1 Tax=uncultured Mycobacteriales bacterium TaxID=581187 RepID=A0A6J4J4B4_9ACTN|nr:MAG: hypothetical protein AVDCRST_MAG41-2669 [uncultured Corynebacteriales bacterium]